MLGFNFKKSVQALNYFAIKEGGKINKMKALKLIWLSDRLHLRRYGRPILNDTYFALTYGPIASNTKDLVEATDFLSDQEQSYRATFISTHSQYYYESINNYDEKVFSKTDREIMEIVYQSFGKLNLFQLSEESHKYPEWKKFENSLQSGNSSRFAMSYKDFFSNYKENEHKIFRDSQESLEISKNIFLENENIYKSV
ncbi:MAG: Panacea domain-containing protein [Bacteroidota bacterium]